MAKFQPRAQTEGNDDGRKEKMIAVNRVTKVVKVIKSGELSKKVVLKGVGATAGAKAAIEAAGGSVG